jgi:hypothetical protein
LSAITEGWRFGATWGNWDSEVREISVCEDCATERLGFRLSWGTREFGEVSDKVVLVFEAAVPIEAGVDSRDFVVDSRVAIVFETIVLFEVASDCALGIEETESTTVAAVTATGSCIYMRQINKINKWRNNKEIK